MLRPQSIWITLAVAVALSVSLLSRRISSSSSRQYDSTLIDTRMRVIITGASGLLGRAVTNHYHAQNASILPLSFTRTSSPLCPSIPFTPLDLLDSTTTRTFLTAENARQPIDWLIHCAAERRPDVAEKDPERAEKLNVGVVKDLVGLCGELAIGMIYISTDYVFDGKNHPYLPSAPTNPLNAYGLSKASGEVAVLRSREMSTFRIGQTSAAGEGDMKEKNGASVLRVPILYGEAEYNSETAVNVLIDVIEDQSGKKYKMDHFAVRFPTCVEDVARVIYDLTALHKPLPPIIHYSSQRPFTKYQMTTIIASHLNLPIEHVIPDEVDPNLAAQASGATMRPGNTQLDVRETRELGVDVEEGKGFEDWWDGWASKKKTV